MKKWVLISIVAFGFYFPCYSQVLTNFQGNQYEQKNDKWYNVDGHVVNTKIVTIKLRDQQKKVTDLHKIGRKVRENTLGYIDLELLSGFFFTYHCLADVKKIRWQRI